MIENGAYKLKKHIKNSRPSGHRDHLWTACEYLPPKNDEEWGYRDPEDFLFVVRDVFILGRKYQEIIYAVAQWSSGYYIGEVPCVEHFPSIHQNEVERELYSRLQYRAEEPAPEDFLQALVPVERATLTEILLNYAQYEGIDPEGRFHKNRWNHTVYTVLEEMGRADQILLQRFETGLRMLLIKDSNQPPSPLMYHNPEKQKEYEDRVAQECAEIRDKQDAAFQRMEADDQKRKQARDEERRRLWDEEHGTGA